MKIDPGISLLSSKAEHFAGEGHYVTVICGRFIRMGQCEAQRLERRRAATRCTAPSRGATVARGAISPELYALSRGSRADIRPARNWEGKCVAIFAGTIGYAQDVDALLDAVALLSDREDLRIVLVGDSVFGPRVRAATERLPISTYSRRCRRRKWCPS